MLTALADRVLQPGRRRHQRRAREDRRATTSPKFAAHSDAICLNPKLFARIKALYDTRATLGLDAEGVRLVERYHTDFVRAGAKLSDADKAKLKAMNAELAELGTKFSQNVLKEVNDSAIVVDSRDELAGLSDEQIAAAAEAAKTRKLEGKYVHRAAQHHRPAAGNLPDEPRPARAPAQGLDRARQPRQRVRQHRHRRPASPSCAPSAPSCWATRTTPPTCSRTRPRKTAEAVNEMLGQLAPAAVANAKQAKRPTCRR